MRGRKTGGRRRGTPNRITVDIRAAAQIYGPAAVERLALIAGLAVDARGQPVRGAENEATQLGVLRELLDRGYGRATQPIASDENGTTITMLHLTAARAVSAGLGRAPVIDARPEDAGRGAPQLADLLSGPPPLE
jgi:hypothetical protein